MKLDEALPTGETRREAALQARGMGLRYVDVAGAAMVSVSTLKYWLKHDDEFHLAFARAKSEGVAGLIAQSRAGQPGSRECIALLGRCFRYSETIVDPHSDEDVLADGEQLDPWEVVKQAIQGAPHEVQRLLEEAAAKPG